MKLYFHPVSTTSRTVMLGAAEMAIALDYQVVDLLTGEHLQPHYVAINPNRLVPVLDDGDFRLTESATILRYLAAKSGSPAYPDDLRGRARVDEMIDWVNSNLYKDLGYGLVYPQLFPNHRRADDLVQQATLTWASERTREWLEILDQALIGPDKGFLCGDRATIADYFGGPVLSLLELIGTDLGRYPNLARWLANLKALASWGQVNEVFDGLSGSVREMTFVTP